MDKHGFLRSPPLIGRVGDPLEDIYAEYARVKKELHQAKILGTGHGTLFWIRDKYLESDKFRSLAPKTQADNRRRSRVLEQKTRRNSKIVKLGQLHVSQLTTSALQRLLETRYQYWKNLDRKGEAEANHEHRLLSAMITWVRRRFSLKIDRNPCHGVELIKEQPVDRYVTDEEFHIQRDIAAKISPYLPVFFDIAYLDACRQSEVRDLNLEDITTDGLIIRRKKGSETNLVQWSDSLHAAVLGCLKWHEEISQNRQHSVLPSKSLQLAEHLGQLTITIGEYEVPLGYRGPVVAQWLIPSPTGEKLSANTFNAAMQRLKHKMKSLGKEEIYWTAHDLKRKGHSEADDDHLTGHKSEVMRQRYRVKARKVKPVK
ncbi:MAG: hypothetical protein RPU64_05755 [Candidatus Sedimenticola sp. (ex Thyasira tokunagai)]